MARRGDELREHILWVAKDVFLEMGFERASMDVVARRGETSKRSLYAHFESKEKLFLAVIDLVRGLFLGRLRLPGDYADEPAQALAMFCGRYLEILLYQPSVQMCRVSMAETARFPQGAAQHYDVMFTEVETRLSTYLQAGFSLSAKEGTEAAQRLIGQVIYPRYVRALFGIDALTKSFDGDALAPDFDLAPIRRAVENVLKSLPTRQ
ncbi:TetR/AcrR family transcriptional regulator [Acerihabitans sp. KWT182]|uniref:TetR/AcrR family transcriptional regulator n=1 Tax=Acerihabitans sp. KWT182 TaxID=3157919 RepID=A0AAU7QDG8_9GAMM